MRIAKFYIKHFLHIIVPMGSLLSVVVLSSGSAMIDLGICMHGEILCIWGYSFLFIISMALSVWFIGLILCLAFDVLRLVFIKLYKKLKSWQTKPKLKHKFILPSDNNLILKIINSKFAKEVSLEIFFRGYKNIKGQDARHQEELISRVFHQFIDPAIVRTTLAPNTKIEVEVGTSRDGKIELQINGFYISGFRDGTYNYRVGCSGKYLGEEFSLPDFNVWLTILDGVLIEIKDKL